MADEHEMPELVRPTLESNTFDKEKMQQQEVEAVDEDSDENSQPQQEVNDGAAALMAERFGDAHLFDNEDGSPGPAEL
jgi:hypothetical protein